MKSVKSFLMSLIIFKPFLKKIKSFFKSMFLGIFQILIIIFSPFLIPIMKLMATTGAGTNICLKYGFLPVPVHFYQPIPDIPELERRNAWDRINNIRGIKFEPENNIKFIKQLAQNYADECNWPNEPTRDVMQFYLHNGSFSYGCATPLHCIIRYYKPKRIVEIGSGNSSKVIAAAIELNILDNHQTNYTIIDPYSNLDQKNFPKSTNIKRKPVELMDLTFFESLEENDILFIDSSHISKIGSDVNFEILEILPLLKKGVFIHFHDIPIPFEYPKIYATNPSFRMFWTESYLLQAFLICNNDFQIILPMSYLQRYYLEDLKEAFPHSLKTDFGWFSGSFWIKRISKSGNE
jgi:hypothetical protein